MPYEFKNKKGVTYYLHSREVELRGGKSKPSTILPEISGPVLLTRYRLAIKW